jgi:uncharacterized membrane protein
MRSSSAPALVGQIRAHENRNGSKAKNVLGALFVGELIADLLPFMPARTKPFSLLARVVSGASSAARLDADRSEKLRAAVLGAAGAIGASFLFYQLRKELGRRYDTPDYLLALGEDAVLIGLAVWLLKQAEESNAVSWG